MRKILLILPVLLVLTGCSYQVTDQVESNIPGSSSTYARYTCSFSGEPDKVECIKDESVEKYKWIKEGEEKGWIKDGQIIN